MKNKSYDIKWHPAFFSAIQLEFEEDKDKLEFTNEYQLSQEPLRIDVRIIKKKTDDKLKNELGNIFKKINILEYKSPSDYLSINDFYKVYGYACLYKGLTTKTDEVGSDEITITFCCKSYPKKLMNYLKEERKCKIEEYKKGIYYIEYGSFPIQIVLNTNLSEEEHLYLRSLDNNLKDETIAKNIIDNLIEDDINKKALLEVVFKANPDIFKEVLKMGNTETLKKVMDEVYSYHGWDIEIFNKGIEKGVEKGIEKGIEKGENMKAFAIAVKMLNDGENINKIIEWTELSEKQLNELKNNVK